MEAPLLLAAKIPVQHVNNAGGVNGRPLALVVEDSKGNPEGAVSAMRKIVHVDHVAAVLSIFTNVVSAQLPLADHLKVPLVSTVASPGLVSKSEWASAHGALVSRLALLVVARWKRDRVKRIFAVFPNGPLAKYATEAYKSDCTHRRTRSLRSMARTDPTQGNPSGNNSPNFLFR